MYFLAIVYFRGGYADHVKVKLSNLHKIGEKSGKLSTKSGKRNFPIVSFDTASIPVLC